MPLKAAALNRTKPLHNRYDQFSWLDPITGSTTNDKIYYRDLTRNITMQ